MEDSGLIKDRDTLFRDSETVVEHLCNGLRAILHNTIFEQIIREWRDPGGESVRSVERDIELIKDSRDILLRTLARDAAHGRGELDDKGYVDARKALFARFETWDELPGLIIKSNPKRPLPRETNALAREILCHAFNINFWVAVSSRNLEFYSLPLFPKAFQDELDETLFLPPVRRSGYVMGQGHGIIPYMHEHGIGEIRLRDLFSSLRHVFKFHDMLQGMRSVYLVNMSAPTWRDQAGECSGFPSFIDCRGIAGISSPLVRAFDDEGGRAAIRSGLSLMFGYVKASTDRDNVIILKGSGSGDNSHIDTALSSADVKLPVIALDWRVTNKTILDGRDGDPSRHLEMNFRHVRDHMRALFTECPTDVNDTLLDTPGETADICSDYAQAIESVFGEVGMLPNSKWTNYLARLLEVFHPLVDDSEQFDLKRLKIEVEDGETYAFFVTTPGDDDAVYATLREFTDALKKILGEALPLFVDYQEATYSILNELMANPPVLSSADNFDGWWKTFYEGLESRWLIPYGYASKRELDALKSHEGIRRFFEDWICGDLKDRLIATFIASRRNDVELVGPPDSEWLSYDLDQERQTARILLRQSTSSPVHFFHAVPKEYQHSTSPDGEGTGRGRIPSFSSSHKGDGIRGAKVEIPSEVILVDDRSGLLAKRNAALLALASYGVPFEEVSEHSRTDCDSTISIQDELLGSEPTVINLNDSAPDIDDAIKAYIAERVRQLLERGPKQVRAKGREGKEPDFIYFDFEERSIEDNGTDFNVLTHVEDPFLLIARLRAPASKFKNATKKVKRFINDLMKELAQLEPERAWGCVSKGQQRIGTELPEGSKVRLSLWRTGGNGPLVIDSILLNQRILSEWIGKIDHAIMQELDGSGDSDRSLNQRALEHPKHPVLLLLGNPYHKVIKLEDHGSLVLALDVPSDSDSTKAMNRNLDQTIGRLKRDLINTLGDHLEREEKQLEEAKHRSTESEYQKLAHLRGIEPKIESLLKNVQVVQDEALMLQGAMFPASLGLMTMHNEIAPMMDASNVAQYSIERRIDTNGREETIRESPQNLVLAIQQAMVKYERSAEDDSSFDDLKNTLAEFSVHVHSRAQSRTSDDASGEIRLFHDWSTESYGDHWLHFVALLVVMAVQRNQRFLLDLLLTSSKIHEGNDRSRDERLFWVLKFMIVKSYNAVYPGTLTVGQILSTLCEAKWRMADRDSLMVRYRNRMAKLWRVKSIQDLLDTAEEWWKGWRMPKSTVDGRTVRPIHFLAPLQKLLAVELAPGNKTSEKRCIAREVLVSENDDHFAIDIHCSGVLQSDMIREGATAKNSGLSGCIINICESLNLGRPAFIDSDRVLVPEEKTANEDISEWLDGNLGVKTGPFSIVPVRADRSVIRIRAYDKAADEAPQLKEAR